MARVSFASRRERWLHVVALYNEGLTFGEIGTKIGVSHQRAHQIWLRGVEIETRRWQARSRERVYWHNHERLGLGRPLDMGGPRDKWLEFRLGDGQTIGG